MNQTVTIQGQPGPVTLQVNPVAIRGTVMIGERPIRGDLAFGGANGPVNLTFKSDSDGRFEGVIPGGGRWLVQVVGAEPVVAGKMNVLVEPDENREARLTLELPDTRLRGRVQDEDGRPAKAFVSAHVRGRPLDSIQLPVSGDGTFSLDGLPRETIFIEARGQGGVRSTVVSVSLAEDPTEEITLVLRLSPSVEGYVRDPTGTPIPGASLFLYPIGTPVSIPLTRTDLTGRFSVSMPAGPREASVLFWADGFPMRLQRVALSGDPILLATERAAGSLLINFPEEVDLFAFPAVASGARVPVVASGGVQWVLSGLWLQGIQLAKERPTSSKSRTFRISGVATGEYAICAQTHAGVSAGILPAGPCVRGVVNRGEELVLDAPSMKTQN